MDTDSLPPSVFEKIPGGRFGETAWGTIQLSNFSQVMGVFVENANASNIRNYHAQFFTSCHKGVPGIYQYSVNLVIAHKLNAINKHPLALQQPFAHTQAYSQSFVPHTSALWNSLPYKVVSIPRLHLNIVYKIIINVSLLFLLYLL